MCTGEVKRLTSLSYDVVCYKLPAAHPIKKFRVVVAYFMQFILRNNTNYNKDWMLKTFLFKSSESLGKLDFIQKFIIILIIYLGVIAIYPMPLFVFWHTDTDLPILSIFCVDPLGGVCTVDLGNVYVPMSHILCHILPKSLEDLLQEETDAIL